MSRIQTIVFAAALCLVVSPVVAAEPCKDCDATTGLTVREAIVKQRAEEARRRLDDTDARPWEGEKGREAFGRPEPTPKVSKQ